MIPRTYPSRVNSTTGRVEALVSFISSTTGLQRWVDYTPVAFVTDATPVEGSYNNNGYIAVADVGSTAGLQAGKDYIRVYLDPNATDAWRVNSVGFIPVGYSGIGGIPYALFANNEQGVWYDPSDFSTMFQDSAGTVPVTAVEQPVGRILDKSGRGNHAFQTTSTSRPVLSARYNLLTKTEQFDDAVWSKRSATVVQDSVVAPDGVQSADLLRETTATDVHRVTQVTSTLSPQQIRVSIRHKAASGGRNLDFAIVGGGGFVSSIFSSSTGEALSAGDSPGSAFSGKQVSVAGPDAYGFYTAVITVNLLVSATLSIVYGLVNGTNNAYAGDGTSGIYIWGADLRVTNDAAGQPAYQRVNTATDYDTTGFKPYLRFDGTDDWLQTNSINFTGTDKMTVFAGVRKLSDAAQGALLELSSASINGTFTILAPQTTSPADILWRSRGTATSGTTASLSAPVTFVMTGQGDIANDICVLRVNGTQAGSSTADQGTGNFGNYPLYIGRRGGTTLPFNGRIYGLIVRGAATTTATIQATETYMNGKTGAY